MGNEDKATKAARAALAVLEDRKGFDWWWEDIDRETRKEIRQEIAERIREVMGS